MIPYKLIAGLVLIISALSGAYLSGYISAENKLQPIITERDAHLLAIDLKAKADTIKQKEIASDVKAKDDKYRHAIDNYKRLLHTKNNPSPGTPAKDTERVDPGSQEQTPPGCDYKTELDLLEDMRVMSGMVEHFRRGGYPTE